MNILANTNSTSKQDPERIRGMFARIASRYDITNSALSFGLHWSWKKRFVNQVLRFNAQPTCAADLATGSGDIALLLQGRSEATVLASDFCLPMMQAGKRADRQLRFHVADATRLPYSDASMDIITISFGIRNVTNRQAAYRECYRCLRRGGIFAVLEFGQPDSKFFRAAYQAVSSKILPLIGGLCTGDPSAYRYLHESSALFPCGQAFEEEVTSATDMKPVHSEQLFFGVCRMYLFRREQ
jgi:demethylmenaquinone methyltransferase/2-methoxy-6-polyprenyl-1,4-benzoquinol methylase